MPKRPRSPDAHSEKRSRHRPTPSSPNAIGLGLTPLFDLDELFLRVLAHLGPADLARAQAVSRRWSAISLDPQLWKRLYLARYPHPHHHVSRSTSGGNTPLRPLARLPSRAFPPPSPSPSPAPETETHEEPWKDAEARHDGVDWKLMLRLGTNWSNGSVLSEARVPLPPSPASQTREDTAPAQGQYLALFPSFICASNPGSPLVHVYASLPGAPLGIIPPPPGWSSPHRPDYVAAIAADQAVASREGATLPARLMVAYASGGFAIVRLRVTHDHGSSDNGGPNDPGGSARPTPHLHWSREAVWSRRTRPPRRGSHADNGNTDPVALASMYHPTLVTCTRAFVLSVYSLAAEPVLLGSLRSDVSFHPASLALFPPRSSPPRGHHNNNAQEAAAGTFRAALTYTAPVYPSTWTVAVQELHVDISRRAVHRSEAYTVAPGPRHPLHSRHPAAEWPEWPRRLCPVTGVRRPISVGSDGRWCVLAGEDAVVYVFALPREANTGGDVEEGEGITHAQTLLAPSAGVASLALQAGRCVSGGRDGRVLVWDLDEEEGTRGQEREDEGEGEAGGEPTEEEWGEARVGRIDAVEVRRGGRRVKGAVGGRGEPGSEDDATDHPNHPHPTAISHIARGLFLAAPPATLPPAPTETRAPADDAAAIRHLAFDEEKIVGLIDGPAGDVMRVWSFV